jgi:hypothetical protein
VLFLAELNHLEIWATDIGNAYQRGYSSLQGQSLGSVKDTSLSSAEHYTVYKVVVLDGMIDLPTVFEN